MDASAQRLNLNKSDFTYAMNGSRLHLLNIRRIVDMEEPKKIFAAYGIVCVPAESRSSSSRSQWDQKRAQFQRKQNEDNLLKAQRVGGSICSVTP